MNQKLFRRRIYVTGLALIVLSAAFIVRLIHLHYSPRIIIKADENSRFLRGSIKDRNGFILAISIEKESLFANPEEISSPAETAGAIAPLLNMPVDTILEKLKKKKRFVWIARMLDNTQAAAVHRLGIRGLYFRKEYQRVYPHERLAANIVGFVGSDHKGLEGIEYSLNDVLAGEDSGSKSEELRFGRNVVLTIDRLVQDMAEREIARAVEQYRARQGAVLVLEVKTGRVLAFAKAPSYNPNAYRHEPAFALRNFSVIDSFEPGSTLKIMTIASIMTHNPRLLNLAYECKGFIDIADTRINCTGVHGSIGVEDIIRHSCNVGVIRMTRGIKKRELYDTLKRFGFGEKTGIELPGETEGILRSPDRWSGLSKYSISIGHEISVTSLQLAAAFAAIANRGVYMAPTIIESIEEHDGTPVRRFKPRSKGRVLPAKACEKIMKLMRGVVTGGTGRRASSTQFCVAGKTGTSQKFIKAKGYTDRVLASFIGVAPCADPEVCVLVVIDDPADKLSGGEIATPVFAQIIDRILINRCAGGSRLRPGSLTRGRVPRRLFHYPVMPDCTGMRMSEVIPLASEIRKHLPVSISFIGDGVVYDQKPKAGQSLQPGSEIVLYFR